MSEKTRTFQLRALTLTNFKGVRYLQLQLEGRNATIYGKNGAGKTTVADAFHWLLFGKDSANKKDFGIKTVGPDGEPQHNLNHEVEAVLSVDGQSLTLKKVFSEKWTKKRGSATAQFSGHTTDHFVDGVPVSEKEYAARVADIADEAIFRLLTSPTYFNEQLHWQDRRQMLLRVVGDLTDAEVIASDPALAELPALLQGRKLDDQRKVVDARRRELNAELAKVPVRIDEATRNLPDLTGVSIPTEADIAAWRTALATQQQARQDIVAGGAVAQKRLQLREVEAALLQMETRAKAAQVDQTQGLQAAVRKLRGEWQNTEAQIAQVKQRMTWVAQEAQEAERQMATKREEWHVVNAETFTPVGDIVCAACGQDLPEDRVAEAHAKAEAAFNLDKSQRLERIQTEGKGLKARHGALTLQHSELAQELTALEAQLADQRTAADDALRRAEEAEQALAPIAEDPAYQAKRAEKEALLASLQQLQGDASSALEAVDAEIRTIQEQLRAAEAIRLRQEQRQLGEQRIAELQAQEKALAREFEALERQLYLMDQFVRAKVTVLETRINSRFRYARFKLFESQINGGLQEVCITTYLGVPYPDLNHAAQIQVGLDIVRTLSEHYGMTAPIIIDGRESVSELPAMDAQLISLIVSPQDPTLRVELDYSPTHEKVAM